MPKTQGFASLTPAERKVMATRGGRASQASVKAHRFTPEESRAGGMARALLVKRSGSALGKKGGTEKS